MNSLEHLRGLGLRVEDLRGRTEDHLAWEAHPDENPEYAPAWFDFGDDARLLVQLTDQLDAALGFAGHLRGRGQQLVAAKLDGLLWMLEGVACDARWLKRAVEYLRTITCTRPRSAFRVVQSLTALIAALVKLTVGLAFGAVLLQRAAPVTPTKLLHGLPMRLTTKRRVITTPLAMVSAA